MNGDKTRNAVKTMTITSVSICAIISAFFTLVGASAGTGELGMHPIITLPTPLWIAWGIFWGAICGLYGARFLIKILTKKRNILYGLLLGLLTGVIIGAVNGILTGTAFFGVFLGVVLGPIPGLVLAAIFLKANA